MDEEAGFLAALIAEPGDRTGMLVYADWLDERHTRDDRRAEYLRRIATVSLTEKQLDELRGVLHQMRATVVTDRCGPGCTVHITGGPFLGCVGRVAGLLVMNHRVYATVRLVFWGEPAELEIDNVHLASAPPPE
jgi:uncharacterized protein (TIGR02996 family)